MITNSPGTTTRPRSRKGNGTSQKVALALAAGLAAFVVMVLGATMAYVVLGGASSAVASASAGSSFTSAPGQVPAPSFPGTSNNQGATNPQDPGAGGSITGSGYPVSADQATDIALNSSPSATLVQQPQLVNVRGTVAYAVPLSTGYVLVDATSGQVLYNAANGFGDGGRRFRRHSQQTTP